MRLAIWLTRPRKLLLLLLGKLNGNRLDKNAGIGVTWETCGFHAR